MSDKELNLPDYIHFVYNRFIMTRVEYLIFTQNEQEAKVLRVIEWCIDNRRQQIYTQTKNRTPQGEKVELPEIIWVPISHSFMLSQLKGTIQSETTLKDILSRLKKKHLIFKEKGGNGPYDPPIYTINKHLMAKLSQLLPDTLDDIDMQSIMKQEREVKKPREGQKLTPSKIDPLVQRIREAINAPLDPQLLALYSPKIDPLLSSRGGQLLTPKIYKENTKENNKRESITPPSLQPEHVASHDAGTPSLLDQIKNATPEERAAILAMLQPEQPEQPVVAEASTPPSEEPAKKPTRKPRVKKATFEIPEELKPRVASVYAKFDALRQQVMNDQDERFIRNEESDRAICALFAGKPPTEKKLETLFKKLWDSPRNPKNGFMPREHMTIPFICKEYTQQDMSLTYDEKKQTGQAPYTVGGYTVKPSEKPVEDLPFIGPASKRRKRA